MRRLLRMSFNDKIAICLATFNGEKYLSYQLDSLLRQTYQNFVIFIGDDDSTDNTLDIIKHYTSRYPDKIVLLRNDKKYSSAQRNFMRIFEYVTKLSEFKYYMFCDQDDVWHDSKIEKTYNKIKNVEKKYPKKPVLIHTDLRVVDAELNVIGNSFWKYRNLNPERKSLNRLLIQNNVTGCTMMWNGELSNIVLCGGSNMGMHDWWFALCASAFGKIDFIEEPLIDYRQHGNNVIGATKVNSFKFIIKRLFGKTKVKETFNISFKQASDFLDTYKKQINQKNKLLLIKYIDISKSNKIKKIYLIFKYKFLKQGFVQNVGVIIYI